MRMKRALALAALAAVIILLLAGCYKEVSSFHAEDAPSEQEPVVQPIKEPEPPPEPELNFTALQAVANHIDETRLFDTYRHLSDTIGNRFSGTQGNNAACDYITGQLEQYGYESGRTLYTQGFYSRAEVKEPIETRGDFIETAASNPKYYFTRNIVATLPSSVPDAPIIIVECHYDSVSTPGAIDNASGVAAVLELARVFEEGAYNSGCELRFCFFSGEEQGFYGASAYLARIEDKEFERLLAAFIVDMAICGVNDAPKVFTVGTLAAFDENGAYIKSAPDKPVDNRISKLAARVTENEYPNGVELLSPFHAARNDIIPFYRNGIEAACLSWRELDENGKVVAPIYMHTNNDTVANTSFETLMITTRVSAQTLAAYISLYI